MTNVCTVNNKYPQVIGCGYTRPELIFVISQGSCMRGVYLKNKLRYTEQVDILLVFKTKILI